MGLRYTQRMDIAVRYSPETDLENYISKIFFGTKYDYGRTDLREKLLKDCSEEVRALFSDDLVETELRSRLLHILRTEYERRPEWYEKKIQDLAWVWGQVGSQVEYALARMYGRPFPFAGDTLTVNFTTLFICPYRYEERMIFCAVKQPNVQQVATVLHELNHFMFYYYFGHLRSSLSEGDYELLKESLTFFSSPDRPGYPAEKPLRELYLSKQWGSLDEAVEAGMELLQNNH